MNNHCPFHPDYIVQAANVIENAGRFEGHTKTRELERVLWRPDGLLVRHTQEP